MGGEGRYLEEFSGLKKSETGQVFDAARSKWLGARRRAAGVRGAPQALAAAGAVAAAAAVPSKHTMTRAEYREQAGRLY